MTAPKVLLTAPRGNPGLLGSYGRAFESLGADVSYWDLGEAINHAVKLGPIGRKLKWETPKLEDVSEQVMAQPYIRFT